MQYFNVDVVRCRLWMAGRRRGREGKGGQSNKPGRRCQAGTPVSMQSANCFLSFPGPISFI